MTTAAARRPWWKKKRCAAAGAVWLLVAYPLSFGPFGYGIGRGWVSRPLAELYVAPISAVLGPPGRTSAGRTLRNYAQWSIELGERHAASD